MIANDEFLDYIDQHNYMAFEVTYQRFWDTERYQNGNYMGFFQSTKKRCFDSNMWNPGVFPNPQAFLVQSIRIKGLTRKMAEGGTMRFIVGDKFYYQSSLDLFTRHEKFVTLDIPIMIGPLKMFKIDMLWDDNHTKFTKKPKIKVFMGGQLARPIQ